jgi:hypothetical protein
MDGDESPVSMPTTCATTLVFVEVETFYGSQDPSVPLNKVFIAIFVSKLYIVRG